MKPIRIRRPRDAQRSKVYRAERSIPDYFNAHRLENVEHALVVVSFITSHAWFRKAYPHVTTVTVEPKHHGCAVGRRSDLTILLPKAMLFKWVLVHELAHLCAPHNARHGRDFCAVFLHLTKKVLGQIAHDQLRDAFIAHRVKFKPKRVRKELSYEQAIAMRERLRLAREAKRVKEVRAQTGTGRFDRIYAATEKVP